MDESPDQPIFKANARLIAAAPELLSELEALVQSVYDNGQWLSGPAYDRVRTFADSACAAIAKATGGAA